MDAYFARRALESLIVAEKKRLLQGESGEVMSAPKHRHARAAPDDDGPAGSAKRARVDAAAPRDWAEHETLSRYEQEALSRMARGSWLGTLGSEREDDDAKWDLDILLREYTPTAVQNVLGHLAACDPPTVRMLVNKHLTPRTAEALTAAFEEADRLRGGSAASDGPTGFYSHFYAAMDHDDPPGTFLARLLSMKEQLAAQATKNVLAAVLGTPASGAEEE